ncbi:TonB-dependent receptor [Niabella drilacis]|nr:TonB-dependent receptor [Niabella drilacis]
MKLTVLLLVAFCLKAGASAWSQQITIKARNEPFKKVMEQIGQQSGYSILADVKELNNARNLSLSLKNVPLKQALEVCFADQPFSYQLMDKTILITSRKQYVVPLSWVLNGKVINEKGEPVAGASVSVKNSNRGASTDLNGKFMIEVDAETDSLMITYVGYKQKTIAVGTAKDITITLEVDLEKQKIEEVVIVGFGTQKKKDMVGAVTSVTPSDLKIPASNLTTALAGRIAGLIAFQRSGEPGNDNAQFFIRGVTTFGYKKDPLILIDGIEVTTTDLARLRVEDIASFSILKDATSTAVYGARGANGVILIATKRGGVGKAKISLNAENSVSMPTRDLELADPVTYMKMANEARATRGNLQLLYSQEKIERTAQPGANPYIFPAVDWREMLFKKQTMNQRYYLNVSGGGGVARYFVSGSMTRDNGVLKVDNRNNFNNNISLKSYSLRSNIDIDVTKSTLLTVRLNGNFDDYTGPVLGGDAMYYAVMHANPAMYPAFFAPDSANQYANHILFGGTTKTGMLNPYAEMVRGYKDYSRSLMLAQLELKQDLGAITKGLNWRTMMNTNRLSYFDVSRFYNPYYYEVGGYDLLNNTYSLLPINEQTGTEYLGYSEGPKTVQTFFYLESALNYNRTFGGKHNISGLLVYMMNQRLNGNAGDLQLSLPFRNVGVSGRATYGYNERYYAEFNFGYNGSERFSTDKRFGFFPSAGIAWNISNETFFEPIKKVVNNFKLRYTYGLVGNDAIGSPQDRFFYLSNVNMNSGSRAASFGFGDGASTTYALSGVQVNRYANDNITWEKSKQQNLGIEMGILEDLNLKADFFKQERTNILMTRYVPASMGLAAATMANVGKASSKGIDASLDYKKNIGDNFWISGLANFTYAKSRYDVYEEPDYKDKYRSHVGQSIGQVYGYIAERLFIDDAEAANAPRQNSTDPVLGGDIKYLDVNKDGQITEADQVPIGYPTNPEINYGFGISSGYKGIDFSVFFNGIARESFWINVAGFDNNGRYAGTAPFVAGTQVLKAYADSYWSEENQNVYAIWPRLSENIHANNTKISTWFMRNGAFLRLKQVELGYTMPRNILKKLSASTLRIYVNAMNPLTFSNFKLWDPEMGGNGLGYPIQKVYNAGIQLTFN